MQKIRIKPLSVNRSYQDRRFARQELKAYKQELGYSFPAIKIPKGKLAARYEFGVSSKASDGDNLIRPLETQKVLPSNVSKLLLIILQLFYSLGEQ